MNDSNTIEFQVSSTSLSVVETRSTLLNGSALDEKESFGVLGYCVPYDNNKLSYAAASAPWDDKKRNSAPDVFAPDKSGVIPNVYCVDGVWQYSGYEQWITNSEGGLYLPSKYTYSFFAYYPYDNGGWTVSNVSSGDRGAPKFTYKVPFEKGSDGYIVDDNIKDVMLAARYNHLRADGPVPLNFNHLLTAIKIKLHNYDETSVSIQKITLSGSFYQTVLFDFLDGSATYSSTLYPGEFNFGGYSALGQNEETTLEKAILLLPNASRSLGSNVKLNVYYNGNTTPVTFPKDGSNLLNASAGTIYTITLSFVDNTLMLFTQSDNKWENGDDSENSNSNSSTIL